jgi:hypothetical protein
MEASSVRAVMSASAQLPSTMAVPSTAGVATSGCASEEAAGSRAAEDAGFSATDDALALAGEEAERSRLRTTVYQVCVAQSSTWGAASQAAPSITRTSTAMPIPFFTRISRL